MKKVIIMTVIGMSTLLIACDQIPTECQTTWGNIEKLAKESGIPEDALKKQKIQFDESIKQLSKEEAVQSCTAQNKAFQLFK
ncbi:MAG: hypothetical protein H9855_09365 [Candidatus Acinetobacter avistercoris]|nr:hypothetical protein [Candidatus Acinetobacter avistercoris]